MSRTSDEYGDPRLVLPAYNGPRHFTDEELARLDHAQQVAGEPVNDHCLKDMSSSNVPNLPPLQLGTTSQGRKGRILGRILHRKKHSAVTSTNSADSGHDILQHGKPELIAADRPEASATSDPDAEAAIETLPRERASAKDQKPVETSPASWLGKIGRKSRKTGSDASSKDDCSKSVDDGKPRDISYGTM